MPACAFVHGYAFDPGYGMGLEQLLAISPPQPPADFAQFWQRRYTAALRVSPRPRLMPSGLRRKRYVGHDLRYASTDGVEIGGWLLVPETGKVRRGVVFGHGYGSCEIPDEMLPVDETALLFPCLRGLGRSPVAKVSANPNYHVLHNIQDRQRYILGGCVEDLWLAVSSLLELYPEAGGRVAYSGVSFGGGIGAMAMPWDDRVGRVHLRVPTFGHQGLRLTLPCAGSGEAVRVFARHHRYNVMETLAYYDAATAMRNLRVPALVAAALFDPSVPPPGQFAVYNAIAKSLRTLFVLKAGHFDYAEKDQQLRELNAQIARFIMQP